MIVRVKHFIEKSGIVQSLFYFAYNCLDILALYLSRSHTDKFHGEWHKNQLDFEVLRQTIALILTFSNSRIKTMWKKKGNYCILT